MIRIAVPEDAAACCAIYLPTVTDSAITFETEPPSVAQMRQRIVDRLQHYPWLCWIEDGEVLAYAYAGRFRERAAYDWMVESSIYVAESARRRGIARQLYTRLLDLLAQQGIFQVMGVITLPGTASIHLHQQLGFEPAGRWRHAGYKLGQWWDVEVWQKQLAAPADPPTAVTAFSRLTIDD